MLRVLKRGGGFCTMEPNYIFPTNLFAAPLKKEEYGMRLIRKAKLMKWLGIHDVEHEILNFAYTPPFPKKADSFL